jgi:hypothetical protein
MYEKWRMGRYVSLGRCRLPKHVGRSLGTRPTGSLQRPSRGSTEQRCHIREDGSAFHNGDDLAAPMAGLKLRAPLRRAGPAPQSAMPLHSMGRRNGAEHEWSSVPSLRHRPGCETQGAETLCAKACL